MDKDELRAITHPSHVDCQVCNDCIRRLRNVHDTAGAVADLRTLASHNLDPGGYDLFCAMLADLTRR